MYVEVREQVVGKAESTPKVPWYYASLDFPALWAEYPPAPDYLTTTFRMSSDEIRALQEVRFADQMKRAWEVPFYKRHWGKVGLEPGDVRCLDDLSNIPPFTIQDFRESLDQEPLWADYIGIDPENHEPLPLVLQTSGGTTGLPRPMLHAPRDREIQNILTGRRFFMQGVRPFDRVQVALSLGLSNGGFLAREGLWKYTGAVPIMTGSGANTPTRRQIELMKAWKVTSLAGFPAYLRHMANVASGEMGIDPRELTVRRLHVHLGVESRAGLEDAWNAEVYDTYGINECGSLAVESEAKSGMHIFEDAFHLEIADPTTGLPVAAGEKGSVFITTLFKYAAPLIRFNTHDLSQFATGSCPSGSAHRRLTKIFGRSDNMVKLRGVNLFPEAIAEVVTADTRSNGEYICILKRTDASGREDMTVKVERAGTSVSVNDLRDSLQQRLKEVTGLKLSIEVVEPGELDVLTGLSSTSKIKRLIDERA